MHTKKIFLLSFSFILLVIFISCLMTYKNEKKDFQREIDIYNKLIELNPDYKEKYDKPDDNFKIQKDANEIYLAIFSKDTILSIFPHFFHFLIIFNAMLYYYKFFKSNIYKDICTRKNYNYLFHYLKKPFIYSLLIPITVIIAFFMAYLISKKIDINYFANDYYNAYEYGNILGYLGLCVSTLLNLLMIGIIYINIALFFSTRKGGFVSSYCIACCSIIAFFIICELLPSSIISSKLINSLHPQAFYTFDSSSTIFYRTICVFIIYLFSLIINIFRFNNKERLIINNET